MNYVVKSPCRDSSLTNHNWVSEVLNGHPMHYYQMFRLKKCVFLQNRYHVKVTQNVGIHEQVGLFLSMLGIPGSVCNCEERF
uniref:DUF8040 domain-containing protein n=1 Tax=Cajanus cajan TaxID=3821 RepID=A0A151TCY4_CAJCA|nr:hypothetical protein KK1_019508 [Cajanus cajan]